MRLTNEHQRAAKLQQFTVNQLQIKKYKFLFILIESVVDNYVKSSELNNQEQVEERFEGLNREVIKEELVGIKTICEKLTKTSEGKYKTYIAIELSAQKLVAKFHERMMKDELLKIDYDYEKFKETFEKEMDLLK